ncbi:hypothetical protein B7463_g12754, partial [Scytalidium lignicola]
MSAPVPAPAPVQSSNRGNRHRFRRPRRGGGAPNVEPGVHAASQNQGGSLPSRPAAGSSNTNTNTNASTNHTPSEEQGNNNRGRGGRRGAFGRGGRRGGAHQPMVNGQRAFGGQLTSTSTAPAPSPSSLDGEAPAFIPGQPVAPRPRQAQAPRQRRMSKSQAPDISTRTHEDITNGQYECAICTNEVLPNSKIWTCKTCWTVLHLSCVKKWSKNDASSNQQRTENGDMPPPRQWRCPGCNLPKDELPTTYNCWCGKEIEPRSIAGLPPHSCGQTCSKSRVGHCPHPCELICHAGPCPPCTAMGPSLSCFCGKEISSRRCADTNYESGWSCGQICGDLLPCGEHTCPKPCHEGVCGACDVLIDSRCYCGRVERPLPCSEREDEKESQQTVRKRAVAIEGEEEDERGEITPEEEEVDAWIGSFDCGAECRRTFDCGNPDHFCEKTCHPQDLLPAHCEKKAAERQANRRKHRPLNAAVRPGEEEIEAEHICLKDLAEVALKQYSRRSAVRVAEQSCILRSPVELSPQSVDLIALVQVPVAILRPGQCEDAASPCTQPCGRPKTVCEHTCSDPCHAPYPCKELTPCQAKTFITCPCQHQKQAVKCLASKSSPGNTEKTLDCNDECLKLQRNAKLAAALNIDPASHVDDHIPYSSTVLDFYTSSTKFAQTYEREFRVFATSEKEKRLRFKPMQAHQRAFIHALAEDFGLDSESQDPEPHRHVVIFKTPRFVSAPLKTIAQCVKNRPPPAPPSTSLTSVPSSKNAQEPFNAFLLSDARFGLTIDEITTELNSDFKSVNADLDILFLPSGEVVLKPSLASWHQKLESTLLTLKPIISRKLKSTGLAKDLMICTVQSDPNSSSGGNSIARREYGDASGSAMETGGWSQVAKGGGASARQVEKDRGIGGRSSFTVLGK